MTKKQPFTDAIIPLSFLDSHVGHLIYYLHYVAIYSYIPRSSTNKSDSYKHHTACTRLTAEEDDCFIVDFSKRPGCNDPVFAECGASTAAQSRNGYTAGLPPQCGGHEPRTIKPDAKMGSWKLQPDGGYKYPETAFGVPIAPGCPLAPGSLPYPDLRTSGMPFQPSGEGYYPDGSQQPYPADWLCGLPSSVPAASCSCSPVTGVTNISPSVGVSCARDPLKRFMTCRGVKSLIQQAWRLLALGPDKR
ncbi:hypothetical protein T265_03125 [Opisthorchis viverrini]|uniref:Uncharacterized protein n=1 Tax=Opisthorchis viverrini TaxID=6198 RepID=A0A074ZX56_OPIVI|nr:hypothetical protein T265_03125 [Opisthorchis viverrini]KER30517.1 hypothetical protein T265_03125 [Opisthorchis viverrini]